MFRKCLFAGVLLATFTMQTQAISINELNESPQFKRVSENIYEYKDDNVWNYTAHYLNTYSVEVLEYAAQSID